MSDIAAESRSGFLDSLIESYKPKSNTFEVVLERGEVLTFRVTRDSEDLHDLRVGGAAFILSVTKGGLPPQWAEFATKNQSVAGRAYFLSQLSVEPKLSEVDCLKLAKLCPHVFDAVFQEVDNKLKVSAQARDIAEVIDSKNESSAIRLDVAN